MKRFAAALPAVLMFLGTIGASPRDAAGDQRSVAPHVNLVGQVLLPDGSGSRGVEVWLALRNVDGEARERWLPVDEHGHFTAAIQGSVVRVSVVTGLRAEIHSLTAANVPQPDTAGHIDLGRIDLRDHLRPHRMVIRAAPNSPAGPVRAVICFGPPPTGPQGEMVALGSKQFPPFPLDSEVEWLLPVETTSPIYVLVERPAPGNPDGAWWTGLQKVFGPFAADEVPIELVMD